MNIAQIPTIDSDIFTDAVQAELSEWQEICNWMSTAKARETELRQKLYTLFFDDPQEGINRAMLPDGRIIEATRKINRSIDEASLDAVMLELPEDSPYRNVGVLVKYEPKLVMKGFRTLPEDQALIFHQTLIEADGLPQLAVLSSELAELIDESRTASEPSTSTETSVTIPKQPKKKPAKKKAVKKVAKKPVKKKAAKK